MNEFCMMIISISWIYILSAMTLGFAAAVQPGPLSLFLINQTLRAGWKKTFPAIFTPLITDGPVALLCLFLLSHLPPHFLRILQILGGGYILYLAFRALKEWRNRQENTTDQNDSSRKTLLNAMVVNILNPNAYLGWSLVIGPLFLEGWNKHPLGGIAFLACFYITMMACTAGILLLFHLARERGPRIQRTLAGISSVFLAIFGVYQILSGSIFLLQGKGM
jgi:threonine/homoserine/homoserine lactone efflux protein